MWLSYLAAVTNQLNQPMLRRQRKGGRTTMPKRTTNYRDSLMKDLLDPTEAANYLSAASDDPEEETLLLALRDVAEAHQLARVANEAGIARESIYRALSATGNPRTTTLRNIVRALGLRFHFEADNKAPKRSITKTQQK